MDPVLNGDGATKHAGLDNHGMGTVFEELVRRFSEENNEEAASTGHLLAEIVGRKGS